MASSALALQVWDMFVFEGGFSVIKVALALLTLGEKKIVAAEDPQALNAALAACPTMPYSSKDIIKLRWGEGGEGSLFLRWAVRAFFWPQFSPNPLFLFQ